MESGIQIFRSCVLKLFPKYGRKMWASLLLDVILIELGLKTALLFDYCANVSIESLEKLIIEAKTNCKGIFSNDSTIMAVRVGIDIFIVHYEAFISHMLEARTKHAMCSEDNEKDMGSSLLIDVSANKRMPNVLTKEAEHNRIRESLDKIIENTKRIKKLNSSDRVLLDESEDICWSALYGIILNYPVVYWFNTVQTNLAGETLINYQLKIAKKELFGVRVPDNYCICSFTVPKCISLEQTNKAINSWESRNRLVLNKKSISDEILLVKTEERIMYQISI